jgi:hypothetical protein
MKRKHAYFTMIINVWHILCQVRWTSWISGRKSGVHLDSIWIPGEVVTELLSPHQMVIWLPVWPSHPNRWLQCTCYTSETDELSGEDIWLLGMELEEVGLKAFASGCCWRSGTNCGCLWPHVIRTTSSVVKATDAARF